ncbi:hypothetical protein CBA19CS22_37935 [Caballeronia novacaledonica]|uniref:Uncharacterized protein n=1 Tax=Caballeronia novacaledonica TaxID=1544861 RepID=A0ACB5R5J7_9BURK|nr:hypothetical protein CBA19CS22_37935 [Caballeronia novacaledonica]
MTEQTKNSAEASLELRAALHKLEQTMTSGVTALSVPLACDVERMASDLVGIIAFERLAILGREKTIQKAREAA